MSQEISLQLLKEKIIKTDIVITLLVEKNEKISQLREKLKSLYHKYVNKVKECEVLQMKIDLCKLEHDPLVNQCKEVTERYVILESQYQELTNTAQIQYQTKCQQLDLKVKECDNLLQQKEQCNTCKDGNCDTANKKFEKESKQVIKLSNKHKIDQQELVELRLKLKELTSEIKFLKRSQNLKCSCLNSREMIEIEHTKDIATLQDMITKMKLSELKLQEEIEFLKNKISLPGKEPQNDIVETFRDMFDISQIEDQNVTDINIEYDLIREAVFEEINIPLMLTPLSSPKMTSLRDEISGEHELTEPFNNSPISDINAESNTLLSPAMDNLEDEVSEQGDNVLEGVEKLTESFSSVHSPMSEINAESNILLPPEMNNLEDIVSGKGDNIDGKQELTELFNVYSPIPDINAENNISSPKMDHLEVEMSEEADKILEGVQELTESFNSGHSPISQINAKTKTLLPHEMNNLEDIVSENGDNSSHDGKQELTEPFINVYSPIPDMTVESNILCPKMNHLEVEMSEDADKILESVQDLTESFNSDHSAISQINAESIILSSPEMDNLEDQMSEEADNILQGVQELTESFNSVHSPISEINAESNSLSPNMDNLEDKVSDQADNISYDGNNKLTEPFNKIYSPISDINAENNILLSPEINNLDQMSEEADNMLECMQELTDSFNSVHSQISEINAESNILSPKMDNLEDKVSEQANNISYVGEQELTQSFNNDYSPISDINAENTILLSPEMDNLEDGVAVEAHNILKGAQELTESFNSPQSPISEINSESNILSPKMDNLVDKVSEQANNISYVGEQELTGSFNNDNSPISDINAENNILLSPELDNLEDGVPEEADNILKGAQELTESFNSPQSPISEINSESNILSPKMDNLEDKVSEQANNISYVGEQELTGSFNNDNSPISDINAENTILLSPEMDNLEDGVPEEAHNILKGAQELTESFNSPQSPISEINSESNILSPKMDNLEDKVSEQANNISYVGEQELTGSFNNDNSPISDINAENNILLSPEMDNLEDGVPEEADNILKGAQEFTESFDSPQSPISERNAESNALLSPEMNNLEGKMSEEIDTFESEQRIIESFKPLLEMNTESNTSLLPKIHILEYEVPDQADNTNFEDEKALSDSFNSAHSSMIEINGESNTLLSHKIDHLEYEVSEQADNITFDSKQELNESFNSDHSPISEMNAECNTLLSPKRNCLENIVSEEAHITFGGDQELFKSLNIIHSPIPEINTKSNINVENMECKPSKCHLDGNLNSTSTVDNQPNSEISKLTLGKECIFEEHRDSSDELFTYINIENRCSTPEVQLNSELLETSDLQNVLPCTTSVSHIISTMLNENSLNTSNFNLETFEMNEINNYDDDKENVRSEDCLGDKFKIVDADIETCNEHNTGNNIISETSYDIYLQSRKYVQEIIRYRNENCKYGIPFSSMFGDFEGFLIQVDNVSVEIPKNNSMDLSAVCHNMNSHSISSQDAPVIIEECTLSEDNCDNVINNVKEMDETLTGKIDVTNDKCTRASDMIDDNLELAKEKEILKNRRPVRRKKLIFNKFKSELLKELFGYVDRKMKMNVINMKRNENYKFQSIKFRKRRKIQMLRWRKLRELYLPNTDTESSETSKKFTLSKRNKSKPKSQCPIEINKETNISSSSSEDINNIKNIFQEQRACQSMVSEHKELEDFYHNTIDVKTDNETNAKVIKNNDLDLIHICNSINNVTAQEIDTPINSDKDSSKSIDSGYIKSDSDVDLSRRRGKKRPSDCEDIESRRKIMACQNVNNYITRSKQIKLDIKRNIDYSLNKNKLTQEICAVLQDIEATDNNLSLNSSKTSEDCDNRDNTSIEYLKDNILENTNTSTAKYLFGSDCETIHSDNNKAISNLGKTKNVKPIRNRRTSENVPPRRSPRLSITKTNSTRVESKTKSKTSSTNIKRSSDNLDVNEETSAKLELTPHEDPLHLRLRQESLIKPKIIINNKKQSIRVAYKRSNSLRNRPMVTSPTTCQIEATVPVNTAEEPKTDVKKIVKLTENKAKALLRQIFTFPDKTSLVDEVIGIFSTHENTHIVKLIMKELSINIYSKPDTKHTPPAPVMTETQRILLGLLVKLDRTSSPNLLDTFMLEAEQYLFTCKILNCLENVTRLYLSVCKLRKNMHRMRRIVCDAFYFMGDFCIPFLFTVLSTWIEVFPCKSESSDDTLVHVLIEIIKNKNCKIPGFNLIPLKKLLNSYYGYEMVESNITEVFNELFNKYTETPSKSVEYALLIFCKNSPVTWVLEKINVNIIPFMEKTESSYTKENVKQLIESIKKGFE